MTEPNKPKKTTSLATLMSGLALAVSVAAMSAVIYTNKAVHNDLRGLTEQVSAQQSGTQSFSFSSEANFQEAVVRALNKMVQDRQAKDMELKSQQFELASNDAPGNKKIYGSLNARFTLVEFSETECPFCVRHHPVLKSLVDSSQGNINWQWKHLPLGFHNPAALQQAIVGECVAEQQGNRGFWIYIDEVFKQSAGNGKGVADLTGLVENMGLDLPTLRECVTKEHIKEIVDADIEQASKLGISGTPATIIVDNQTGRSHIISGAQPAGAFTATIERMLKEGNRLDDGEGE